MTQLTISQVAKAAAVNIETLRYYERCGILPAPQRQPSGYRQYPPDAVIRVRFIKHAQALGFSLKEIKELLDLRIDSPTVCAAVKQRAEAKVTTIEDKIQSLQQIKQTLAALIALCEQEQLSGICPLLTALETQSTPPP